MDKQTRRPLFYLPFLLALPAALGGWLLWRHFGPACMDYIAIAVKVVVMP